jgi:poly-gamma-glutamate synthesis protein (capsule biosynthesis protein)
MRFKIFLLFLLLLFILLLIPKILPTGKYNFNFDRKENQELQETKILFVGDVMMTRSVEKKIRDLNKKYIFPFINILDYLKSFDYVIANLEGPISENGVKVGSKYSFRMNPDVTKALNESNINIVNLANNHIFDYGKIAFEDTLKNLDKNNIKYFGISYEPLVIEKNGTKIGFLGFSDFLKHLEVRENKMGIAVINDKMSEIIKKAKEKVDVLIVSFHWGEEYQKLANERQRRLAKIAIDSGADLVIGHHPHVIQNVEKYNGKFIFYSLGNFVFDQNFSKETMVGGGVEVYIKNKKIENIYFRKFYLNENFQIEKMSERLVPYELENETYLFREAKTKEEWQRGLMFVKKPVDYDGMIFIFPDKQIRSFWNQNTYLDLEVYWLDDDKIIKKDYLPSIIKTQKPFIITSPKPANKVIEVIK